MGGLFRTFRIIPTADAGADYEEVLAEAEEQLSQILEVHRGFGCKFYLVASLSMSRLIHEERQPTYHHSKTATLLRSTPILPEVQNQTRVLINKIEEFVRNGSGWVCEAIKHIDLCITRLPYEFNYYPAKLNLIKHV